MFSSASVPDCFLVIGFQKRCAWVWITFSSLCLGFRECLRSVGWQFARFGKHFFPNPFFLQTQFVYCPLSLLFLRLWCMNVRHFWIVLRVPEAFVRFFPIVLSLCRSDSIISIYIPLHWLFTCCHLYPAVEPTQRIFLFHLLHFF